MRIICFFFRKLRKPNQFWNISKASLTGSKKYMLLKLSQKASVSLLEKQPHQKTWRQSLLHLQSLFIVNPTHPKISQKSLSFGLPFSAFIAFLRDIVRISSLFAWTYWQHKMKSRTELVHYQNAIHLLYFCSEMTKLYNT